jgi:penicillin V acylase-like amidase (Ntn superfamily)
MTGFPYAETMKTVAEDPSDEPGVPAMSRLRKALVTLVVLAQVVACPSLVWACTGITIKPKDGSIIFARTLEFAVDLKSNIIVVPRGKEYVGTAPGDKPGLSWKTKFGIVGANAFDRFSTVVRPFST